jgi:hypothetical protein
MRAATTSAEFGNMSKPITKHTWSPGHGAGSQVGTGSRHIAAARQGVSPGAVIQSEPSGLNTAAGQRAAIAAENAGVIQASPQDAPPAADR